MNIEIEQSKKYELEYFINTCINKKIINLILSKIYETSLDEFQKEITRNQTASSAINTSTEKDNEKPIFPTFKKDDFDSWMTSFIDYIINSCNLIDNLLQLEITETKETISDLLQDENTLLIDIEDYINCFRPRNIIYCRNNKQFFNFFVKIFVIDHKELIKEKIKTEFKIVIN